MLEISGVLKVWGIIAISKIDFISFSSTERIIQNRENLKTIQNLISSFGNHFAINSIKSRIFFLFFTENLSFSLPGNRSAALNNTYLPSNNNVSKTMRAKIISRQLILKEYSINF